MTDDLRARIWKRLDELADLKPGWLDGEGIAPSPCVIAYAAAIAESSTAWAGPIRIYPTPAGGIELEWSDDHAAHSITIGPDLRLDLMTVNRDELTRHEAVALADDLGQQLYRAEDRVAFVREMLAGRTGPVDVAEVLAWLDQPACPRAESEQQQIARLTAECDRLAALAEARQRVIERMARESLEAEAAVQRVRDILDLEGYERDRDFLAALEGPGEEQRAARRYAEQVNAPLRQETIAALRERLAAGDYPVRTVRMDDLMDSRVTSHAYEGAPGPGQSCHAEPFGETCNAPWEQHEMRREQ